MSLVPEVLNVLLITPSGEQLATRVDAIAPGRLKVDAVFADFMPELRCEWPEYVLRRYARGDLTQIRTASELEALVREAHVVYLTIPFPRTMPLRAPNLLLAQFMRAGVEQLQDTPWWDAQFPLANGRGVRGVLPIAEMVMGMALFFAKRLDRVVENTRSLDLAPSSYPIAWQIKDKTMGVIGLGAIGREVARLARANGMRVIASRHSARERRAGADGVDVIYPPAELLALLAESDFIAVCAPLTNETRGMLNAAAFAAMKPGAYLLNVARGDIIDEAALIDALRSGRLRGAYLDVWHDDVSLPPSEALKAAPNAIFTPHISSRTDTTNHFTDDVLCENLRRLLNDEPLVNLVDRSRGY
jgi:phosphoglycerate dehydrogenase-like enzyme